ncbi:MAG TPA: hypothetical protein VGL21_20085 [Jatrophihabitantaceae bacterium]|jgi:hypothetical protein
MTEHRTAHDSELSTDQIASAGQISESRPELQELAPTAPAADGPTEGEASAQLLEGEELQGVVLRWREIQAQFVDEPRSAVQDADALVADLMQRLARMFADERDRLESRWSTGEEVSTEDLRQGLRRYRSFFERLLAA